MNSVQNLKINTQPSMSSFGFSSFVKSFGISIENVLGPIKNANKSKFKEHDQRNCPPLVTMDNVKSCVRLPTTYGTEQRKQQINENRSLLQASLKSMFKAQFVSMEEEIQNHPARIRIVIWLSQIYRRARLSSQVFHASVCLIDRFLSLKSIKQSQYQKLALTCLWMSAKFENTKKYSLYNFIQLCTIPYKQFEIVQLQQQILILCNFNLCIPSGLGFLKIISSFCELQKRTYALAYYILELSMLQCKYLNYKKSLLALASLSLAYKINESQNISIFQVIPVNMDRLKQVSRMLLRTLTQHKDSQYSAINRKFASESFFEVSNIEFVQPSLNEQQYYE